MRKKKYFATNLWYLMAGIDFTNIPFSKGALLSFIFFGIIVPPLWFFYQFQPEIYYKTELFKLLIIGVAVGLPVFVFNLLFLTNIPAARLKVLQNDKTVVNDEEDKEEVIERFAGCSLVSIVVFYTPCVISFKEHLSLECAIYYALASEVVMLVAIYRVERSRLKRVQKQINQKS